MLPYIKSDHIEEHRDSRHPPKSCLLKLDFLVLDFVLAFGHLRSCSCDFLLRLCLKKVLTCVFLRYESADPWRGVLTRFQPVTAAPLFVSTGAQEAPPWALCSTSGRRPKRHQNT